MALAIVAFLVLVDFAITPNETETINQAQNTNITTPDSPKACTADEDCGLHMCAGCYNNATLADPNLGWPQCAQYDTNYGCTCVRGQCETVRK